MASGLGAQFLPDGFDFADEGTELVFGLGNVRQQVWPSVGRGGVGFVTYLARFHWGLAALLLGLVVDLPLLGPFAQTGGRAGWPGGSLAANILWAMPRLRGDLRWLQRPPAGRWPTA